MIEIWGRKNSSNVIAVMWAIGEIDLDHIRHNVGGSFKGLDTEEYRQMNPNQLVPTLNDNGLILWESNPIIRYLSKKYSTGHLYPEDLKLAAKADQWMEWTKSSIVPNIMPAFWGLIRLPKDQQNSEQIKQSAEGTAKALWTLERQLENQDFLIGDTLTMADLPLGTSIYRYFNLEIDRPSFPNIEAWYSRLCQRKAYQTHAIIPFGSSLEEWNALEQAEA